MAADHKGFKEGAKVGFQVGKAKTYYEAKVTGSEGAFVVTTDEAGKVRKVRPGACSLVG